MRFISVLSLAVILPLTACSSVQKVNPVKRITGNSSFASSTYTGNENWTPTVRVSAPSTCFTPDRQSGTPVAHHRGSIIDQPVLRKRISQKVPSNPVANRDFVCAAFSYSIDERGRVTDIETLYNSHPGVGGMDFAKMAKQSLKQWQYEPGMVDKAPQRFVGLSTVFYFGYQN